jgi:hypothetical protein
MTARHCRGLQAAGVVPEHPRCHFSSQSPKASPLRLSSDAPAVQEGCVSEVLHKRVAACCTPMLSIPKHSDNVCIMPLFCGLLKSRYILNI